MTLAVMAEADPFPADVLGDDGDAFDAIRDTDLATWLDLATSMRQFGAEPIDHEPASWARPEG